MIISHWPYGINHSILCWLTFFLFYRFHLVLWTGSVRPSIWRKMELCALFNTVYGTFRRHLHRNSFSQIASQHIWILLKSEYYNIKVILMRWDLLFWMRMKSPVVWLISYFPSVHCIIGTACHLVVEIFGSAGSHVAAKCSFHFDSFWPISTHFDPCWLWVVPNFNWALKLVWSISI